jgi:hypothetical protein
MARRRRDASEKGEKGGDNVRATLSYAIVGVALLYVILIAVGYISGWRTEAESTLHLAAVGAFFSGIFGVILGYYFGRQGAGAALAAAELAQGKLGKVQSVTGEMARSLAQLQEVAQKTAKADERVQKIIGHGDNALKALREIQ